MKVQSTIEQLSLKSSVAAVLLSLLAWSSHLGAAELEDPRPRQGYYVSVGLRGTLDGFVTEDRDSYGPWPGAGGELRFGEALNRWVDLGLSLGGGVSIDSDYLATLGHLALDLQFHPTAVIFVRGSLGFGFVDLSRQKKDLSKINGSIGAFYRLAAGYDFFPLYKKGSGGFAVTPVVGIEARQSELITSITGFVGLELTWWTGLGADKLRE